MMHHLIRFHALLVILPLTVAAPYCQRSCGDLKVPYPFGLLGDPTDCYYNESYVVDCFMNRTHTVPYLRSRDTNVQMISFSLEDHELRIPIDVARDCYDSSGNTHNNVPSSEVGMFPISTTKNMFTAIGCDTFAVLTNARNFSYGNKLKTGCLTTCPDLSSAVNGSCSGIGCCQTSIPKNAYSYRIQVSSYDNHSDVIDFNKCSYAFVAANGTFNFSMEYLLHFDELRVPTVRDWSVGNGTCEEGQMNMTPYMCKGNSSCSDAENGTGYRCRCLDGYKGNPYLSGDGGCQDIDECNVNSPCDENAICVNTEGSFNCSCLKGYDGDGIKCVPSSTHGKKSIALLSGTTSGIGVLLLIIIGWWLHKIIKKRQETKLKKKYFEQNGGLLLQQQLSFNEGTVMDKSKVFTSEELDKATDHFNANRILGQGGQGTVYKGMLVDGSIVAIKKSKIKDQTEIQQFINEVVILSQISHRNIVKLLGCCLETEVPLLVYEFIPNGTLYQYLHNPIEEFVLSWDIRLRVSSEIAEALSYLHFTAAIPIYHRDIKTSNILLDQKYRAKIADFGTSKTVAIDQTHATTLVYGTFGYLDPEYFQSSQFTDKSDVYSFGIVLVELLTGQKAVSSLRENGVKSLATYFFHSLAKDHFLDIVDPKLLKEGVTKEITIVANLAKRCLNLNGKSRPSMKEVAMELERLRRRRALDLEEGKQKENEYNGIFELPDIWDVESFKATSSSADQPLLSMKTM